MAGLPPVSDRATRPLSVGGELSPSILTRLAVDHGLEVVEWTVETAEAGGLSTAPLLLLALRGSTRELGVALRLGARAYVEVDDDGGRLLPGLLEWLEGSDRLLLSLSTVTCFSMDLAPLLCRVLAQRGWLGDNRRPDAEMCLHEAISNAVIHGNLGILSGPSGNAEAFDGFYRRVKERLADRLRALRRITIEVVWTGVELQLAVVDEGDGHAGIVTEAGAAESEAKSGRGLRIMGQLADHVGFSDAGRRVHLYFRR